MDEWLKKSLDQKFAEQRSLKATQKDETLKNFGCQNKKCAKYGILGCSNIRVRASYGKNNTRLLHCTRCGQTFSERSDTILENVRIAPEKVAAIIKHLADGTSQRKIANSLGVDRGTVSRYAKLAVTNAQQLHDELIGLTEQQNATVCRKEKLDPKTKRRKNLAAVVTRSAK
jgi:transposase-like protein